MLPNPDKLMSQRWSWLKLILVASGAIAAAGLSLMAILLGGLIYLGMEVEHSRFEDPSGNYEAIVKVPRATHIIPGAPGSGSDASGSIHIYDKAGNFYGSHPVERIGETGLRWEPGKAVMERWDRTLEWDLTAAMDE